MNICVCIRQGAETKLTQEQRKGAPLQPDLVTQVNTRHLNHISLSCESFFPLSLNLISLRLPPGNQY